MPSWVALLRAVNLGATNKVAMADLRALLAGLGYDDVRTHVNSGNAVFVSGGRSSTKHERAIEDALARGIGLNVSVLVRSGAEMAAVVRGNPFAVATADPKSLHVVFLSGAPDPDAARPDTYLPDEFAFGDRCVYVKLASGVQGSRLPSWEKVLGVRATMRTMAVVRTLADLAAPTR